MAVEERDEITGQKTTGHEWNGIKELDTPVPRGIIIFIVVTHLWALAWWILMPAFPIGTTYTKGLIGADQHERVNVEIAKANSARAWWVDEIVNRDFSSISSDEKLMKVVRTVGHSIYGDNCAACHGGDARGGKSFPDLTDNDWIWGGSLEAIAQTIKTGVNSTHDESRISEMPAFGRDAMLDREQVRAVAAYVYSMSHPEYAIGANLTRIEAGHAVFTETCVACHGDEGKGNPEIGAPNLTDDRFIYGGDLETIVSTVHGGRRGHMPTWEKRLSPADIKILALYIHSLSTDRP